jgi:hypothetical protein
MNAKTEGRKKWLALLCLCVVWTAGCFTKRPAAKPIAYFVPVEHPVVPAATMAELEAPPDIPSEVPEAPAELATSPSAPVRPRVTPPPAPEHAPVEKAAEPVIAPELTAQEINAAMAETQRNLDQMEKNLTLARGRTLNASQEDLISKVRGFADGAREAMRNSDWVRAKNLSKKAQVLSEELAASL